MKLTKFDRRLLKVNVVINYLLTIFLPSSCTGLKFQVLICKLFYTSPKVSNIFGVKISVYNFGRNLTCKNYCSFRDISDLYAKDNLALYYNKGF